MDPVNEENLPWVNVETSSPALRREKLKHTRRGAFNLSDSSFSSTESASFSSEDLGYATHSGDNDEEIQHNPEEQVVFGRQIRKSKLFCRRCSSMVTEEDVLEESLETTVIGEEEDDIDGGGQARVYKVIQRCRCRESVVEKLEKCHIGKSVLQPTKIMEKYQKSQSPKMKRNADSVDSIEKITTVLLGCLQATPKMDMAEHFKSETEVFIRDGSSPETENDPVSIGLYVTSLIDEKGLLRHFVGKQPGKPAAEMGLQEGDELLLLNEKVLVDLTVDEMKALFFNVRVDTEFTMFTRRTDGESESKYEYWQITTIIKLEKEDDMIVPEVAYILRATYSNGDIIAPIAADTHNVYIRCDQGYLRNVNGHVKLGDLRPNDPRFRLEILEYHGYVVENNRPCKKELCLIRYSQDMPVGYPPYFLCVQNKTLQFKAAPRDLATPRKEDLQNGTSSGDFSVQDAVFLRYPVNQDEETGDVWNSRVYFESYKKRGHYLHLNTRAHLITLENIEEADLPFRDSAKFDISTS